MQFSVAISGAGFLNRNSTSSASPASTYTSSPSMFRLTPTRRGCRVTGTQAARDAFQRCSSCGAVPEERHAADAVRPVHYRTAALYSVPAVRRQHCRRTYRDSDRLPVSGSAGTPAYLRRSGEMERQALDGYCTSQLAAAP